MKCDDCWKEINKLFHRHEVINDDVDYEIDELDYEYWEYDICEKCYNN